MAGIIEFNKRHLDNKRLKELYSELVDIIGNANLIETEDGDVIMDAISQAKCNAVDTLIDLEYLKAGYTIEEILILQAYR